jgi:hypothetical protein
MAAATDWLSRTHQGLHDQANQTTVYMKVEANSVRMGLNGSIALWINNEFDPKHLEFSKAFDDWHDPATRTPLIITGLEESEKTFIPVYRQLYTGVFRNNPLVTDVDLVAMGLPKHPDPHREPVPDPTGILEIEVKTPSPGVVLFYFRIVGEEGHAKAYGIQGYELRGGVMEEMPQDWSELPESNFTTSSPLHLAFNGALRGKHYYYAARQENNRGVKGDWSPIAFVIIP